MLFPRQEHTLRPDAKKLRETPSLIPRLERELHNELHRNCPVVPALGYYALQRVMREFYPARDTLTSVENYIEAVDIASMYPKTHPIERDLALLHIEAIELQIPYVREFQRRTTFIDLGALREH